MNTFTIFFVIVVMLLILMTNNLISMSILLHQREQNIAYLDVKVILVQKQNKNQIKITQKLISRQNQKSLSKQMISNQNRRSLK